MRRVSIILASVVVLLVGVTLVAGWVAFRPRPVPPAEDWAAQWNELVGEPGGDAARERRIAADLERLAEEGALPHAPADEDDRTIYANEALEAIRFGEWGHPLHEPGLAALELLREDIGAWLTADPPEVDWTVAAVGPPTDGVAADEIMLELVRFRLLSFRVTSALLAESRRAARAGEPERAAATMEFLLRISESEADGPALIHRLLGMAKRDFVLAHMAALAAEGEASAETIRAFLEVIERHPRPALDVDRMLAGERIVGELSVWIEAEEAAAADVMDVARSWLDVVRGTDVHDGGELWRARRVRFGDMTAHYERLLERARRVWEADAAELASIEPPPVFEPAPEVFATPMMPDAFRSTRRTELEREIQEHARIAFLKLRVHELERGRPAARMEDVLSEAERVAPRVGLPLEYRVVDGGGFELRLPESELLDALAPDDPWSAAESLSGSVVGEGVPPIEGDSFSVLSEALAAPF